MISLRIRTSREKARAWETRPNSSQAAARTHMYNKAMQLLDFDIKFAPFLSFHLVLENYSTGLSPTTRTTLSTCTNRVSSDPSVLYVAYGNASFSALGNSLGGAARDKTHPSRAQALHRSALRAPPRHATTHTHAHTRTHKTCHGIFFLWRLMSVARPQRVPLPNFTSLAT